jgi:hypothetical protein
MLKLISIATLCVFSFILTACDVLDLSPKQTEPEAINATEIIILNKDNIDAFSVTFAQAYLESVDDLLAAFEKYNNDENSYKFVRYRNYQWTPNYIKKKDYYQAVLQKNQHFLAQSTFRPLFDYFEGLIFIGISLKKGLLDNNQPLIKKTLVTIEKDRSRVEALLKIAQSH